MSGHPLTTKLVSAPTPAVRSAGGVDGGVEGPGLARSMRKIDHFRQG